MTAVGGGQGCCTVAPPLSLRLAAVAWGRGQSPSQGVSGGAWAKVYCCEAPWAMLQWAPFCFIWGEVLLPFRRGLHVRVPGVLGWERMVWEPPAGRLCIPFEFCSGSGGYPPLFLSGLFPGEGALVHSRSGCVCSFPLCMWLVLSWWTWAGCAWPRQCMVGPCPGSGGSRVCWILSSCVPVMLDGDSGQGVASDFVIPWDGSLASGSPAQERCWMTRWSGCLPARGWSSVWHRSYNFPPSRHIQWHDLTRIHARDAHPHIHTQVFTLKVCNGCCSFSWTKSFIIFNFIFIFLLCFCTDI